jgi:HEPN domain-containing protein
MKIQDLIQEKYSNFIKFIKDKYPENENIEQIENLNVKLVIEYLKTSIYPFKHDTELLMLNISTEYNINLKDFTIEEKEKLKKYMKFFIEMIEEIYIN